MSHSIEPFVDECASCGTCAQACPFLEKHGPPISILQSPDDTVFLCTNCRACTSLCPMNLSPADAFFASKTERIQNSDISARVHSALAGARSFARRGHAFPFSAWKPEKTVFWPGCGLVGSLPAVAASVRTHLSRVLAEPVGLVIDCCFDPAYQLGDVDTVRAAMQDIGSRLKTGGVERVIAGCVNCTKVLSRMLESVTVQHVLEVLPASVFRQGKLPSALHHPCPSALIPGLREKAASCSNVGGDEAAMPACCGCGGGLHVLEPALADAFARVALGHRPAGPVVTYCVGCKNAFQSRGASASHLLEFLPGVHQQKAEVSSGRKWINRLSVGIQARILNPKFLIAIGLIGLIFLTAWLRQSGSISTDGIVRLLNENPVLAPFLFILVYAVGPSIFLPSLPLTLGAGFLWGPFWGVIFSILGSTCGASVAFLLARYVMRDTVKARFGHERWQSLSDRVEQHGWKAVAFARLVPIFPFPVLNYLFGVTPISFVHYAWSSFVFMLPACIAYVAFGSSMGELILHGNIHGILTGILVASFALLLPMALKKIVNRRSGKNGQKRQLI
ncbi:MAG TPA: VTT domain-containing protein [Dissulfurispiraceae bacterium]|nr:VTT domain-containing protein [Dissulfurispiraceae bacterium]